MKDDLKQNLKVVIEELKILRDKVNGYDKVRCSNSIDLLYKWF